MATITETTTSKAAVYKQNTPLGNPFLDSLILPIPQSESMTPVWNDAEVETLHGSNTRKLHSRKYSYTLNWDFMKPQDYTDLENKINELQPMTFTYGRYVQTENGIQVLGELSERVPVTRYPGQTYLSKVTLKVLEVEPR
jgi:hypothetical protein